MTKPGSVGEAEMVEMKVVVPKGLKDTLFALKQLRGVTFSEITTEALEAHLDELRGTGRDV